MSGSFPSTSRRESVLLNGEAHIYLEEKGRRNALYLLVDEWLPEYGQIGYKYNEKSFHRLSIIRMDVKEYSGIASIYTPLTNILTRKWN
jgi:hypothetical protein